MATGLFLVFKQLATSEHSRLCCRKSAIVLGLTDCKRSLLSVNLDTVMGSPVLNCLTSVGRAAPKRLLLHSMGVMAASGVSLAGRGYLPLPQVKPQPPHNWSIQVLVCYLANADLRSPMLGCLDWSGAQDLQWRLLPVLPCLAPILPSPVLPFPCPENLHFQPMVLPGFTRGVVSTTQHWGPEATGLGPAPVVLILQCCVCALRHVHNTQCQLRGPASD